MKPESVNIGDYQKLVESYHGESERAAIVLAGSFVEHYIANFIKHFMVDDPAVEEWFSGFGPFASFDQRISTAYAFRLVPPWMRKDLNLIKKIRNHFAHSPRLTSSDDPKAASMFLELSTAKDPAFNASGDGRPLTDKKLIYLFAVARFVVYAHNAMIQHPRDKGPNKAPEPSRL
jgi:hypothetical protein